MPFAEELPGAASNETIARLIRHGDPVQIRPAGEVGSLILAHYRKRANLTAGSWVYLGASGRAELMRPNSNSTAILFGQGAARVGDARSTPWLELFDFDRVRVMLVPGEKIGLPGGAQLEATGESNLAVGPFVLEQVDAHSFRIHNQGLTAGRIRYREDVLVLEGAQRVTLARIDDASGGTEPLLKTLREIALGRRLARVSGDVAVQPDGEGGFRLTARGGTATLLIQGITLQLADGEEVVWRFPSAIAPSN